MTTLFRKELEEFYIKTEVSKSDRHKRNQLYCYLRSKIQLFSRQYHNEAWKIFKFGSSVWGVDTSSSDIDIAIELNNPHSISVIRSILSSLSSFLLDCNSNSKYKLFITPILNARCPIIIIESASISKIKVDISCANQYTLSTKQVISSCINTLLSRGFQVKKLIKFIKYWSKNRGINNGKIGYPNSFGWTIMVLSYIQNNIKKLLKTLKTLKILKNIKNLDIFGLEKLIIGFYEYYSKFEYEKCSINISLNKNNKKIIENINTNCMMQIIDPADKTNNITKKLKKYQLILIKKELNRGYTMLNNMNNQNHSILQKLTQKVVFNIENVSEKKKNKKKKWKKKSNNSPSIKIDDRMLSKKPDTNNKFNSPSVNAYKLDDDAKSDNSSLVNTADNGIKSSDNSSVNAYKLNNNEVKSDDSPSVNINKLNNNDNPSSVNDDDDVKLDNTACINVDKLNKNVVNKEMESNLVIKQNIKHQKQLISDKLYKTMYTIYPSFARVIADILVKKYNNDYLIEFLSDKRMLMNVVNKLQKTDKRIIGNKLYLKVEKITGVKSAGKITGMLLEMSNKDLHILLSDDLYLKRKISEAKAVLQDNNCTDETDEIDPMYAHPSKITNVNKAAAANQLKSITQHNNINVKDNKIIETKNNLLSMGFEQNRIDASFATYKKNYDDGNEYTADEKMDIMIQLLTEGQNNNSNNNNDISNVNDNDNNNCEGNVFNNLYSLLISTSLFTPTVVNEVINRLLNNFTDIELSDLVNNKDELIHKSKQILNIAYIPDDVIRVVSCVESLLISTYSELVLNKQNIILYNRYCYLEQIKREQAIKLEEAQKYQLTAQQYNDKKKLLLKDFANKTKKEMNLLAKDINKLRNLNKKCLSNAYKIYDQLKEYDTKNDKYLIANYNTINHIKQQQINQQLVQNQQVTVPPNYNLQLNQQQLIQHQTSLAKQVTCNPQLVQNQVLTVLHETPKHNKTCTNQQQLLTNQAVLREPKALTAEMLRYASTQERYILIGQRLFPQIQVVEPRLARKITGMLLESDDNELLRLLDDHTLLITKINEALAVLKNYNHKQKTYAKGNNNNNNNNNIPVSRAVPVAVAVHRPVPVSVAVNVPITVPVPPPVTVAVNSINAPLVVNIPAPVSVPVPVVDVTHDVVSDDNTPTIKCVNNDNNKIKKKKLIKKITRSKYCDISSKCNSVKLTDFDDWLVNTVRLPQYLNIFKENEWTETSMIPFMNRDIFQNQLNIKKGAHINKLVKKVEEYIRRK